jgi:hypothetical protein
VEALHNFIRRGLRRSDLYYISICCQSSLQAEQA